MIRLTEELGGGIDEHTLVCLHFDDENNISKNECGKDAEIIPIKEGLSNFLIDNEKFGKAYGGNGKYFFNNTEDGYETISVEFFTLAYSNIAQNTFDIKFKNSNNELWFGIKQYSNGKSDMGMWSLDTNSGWEIDHNYFYTESWVWNHVYLNISKTLVEVYINGNYYGNCANGEFEWISINGFGLYNNNSYIDEIRVSDIFRHTSNFIPPNRPFMKDSHKIFNENKNLYGI